MRDYRVAESSFALSRGALWLQSATTGEVSQITFPNGTGDTWPHVVRAALDERDIQ